MHKVKESKKTKSEADPMIVAYYRGHDLERDHVPDVICYKAMRFSVWKSLVEKVINETGLRFISFGYDVNEPAMTNLLPDCIATHKDMFAALENLEEEKDAEELNEDDPCSRKWVLGMDPALQHHVKKAQAALARQKMARRQLKQKKKSVTASNN